MMNHHHPPVLGPHIKQQEQTTQAGGRGSSGTAALGSLARSAARGRNAAQGCPAAGSSPAGTTTGSCGRRASGTCQVAHHAQVQAARPPPGARGAQEGGRLRVVARGQRGQRRRLGHVVHVDAGVGRQGEVLGGPLQRVVPQVDEPGIRQSM